MQLTLERIRPTVVRDVDLLLVHLDGGDLAFVTGNGKGVKGHAIVPRRRSPSLG